MGLGGFVRVRKTAFFNLTLMFLTSTPWGVRAELLNTENSLSLQSESFLSSDYSSTQDRNYFFVGASFISKDATMDDSPRVGIDLRGRFSPDTPVLSSFDLRELAFQQQGFAVGRQLLVWSAGDEDWNLGLFEPQYRANVLRPQSQGLTGAFYNVGEGRGRGWNLQIFGTPIFVPDQGAGYVLQAGRFQKVSPWFQSLPREVRRTGSNKVRTLDYQLEVPQLEKIVFNSGYALRLAYDDNHQPSALSLSLAYKPMNTLSLGIDGWALADVRAPVVIEPTITYHKLAALDYAFRTHPDTGKGLEFRAGAVMEQSEEPRDQQPDLTYATYRPMLVTTTSLAYRNGFLGARVAYIRRSGGETHMIGPKAEELSDMVMSRLPYREAVAVQGSVVAYRRQARKLEFNSTWTEGLSETYSRWTVDANWAVDRNWGLWTDLVLVRAQKKEGATPELFTAFENHDSLRAGISYVF